MIEPTPEPIVQPISEPILHTSSNRNPIVDYPSKKYELPESQKQILKDLAFELKIDKFLTLIVSGHTDITGSPEYNLIISQKRADNVKAYLISQGVSPDRVIIEYYGATHPIASNKSAEGRRKNRRVELEMVKN